MSDDVSYFLEYDVKTRRCICVSTRGRRLRQGRPRLSTVSNLRENRSETTVLFDHATLVRQRRDFVVRISHEIRRPTYF